jgi:hypothetical protein
VCCAYDVGLVAMQVFICYSRADKKFAAQLVEDLSEYDLHVWMDTRNIPHGANWDLEVQKGLDSSDLMLVLLTPSAAASQNVADEWSYFLEHDKPVIPLLVQPCDIPFRLSRRQRVDFTTDYNTGFQQLIKALESPALRDPDSTQKMRPVQVATPPALPASAKAAQGTAPAVNTAQAATSTPGQKPNLRATAPEVGIRMLPVVWALSYHWYRGMGPEVFQGDAMINRQEMKLVPHAKPILTIPLRSLVSAKLQRSVDSHLKITYYGPDNTFQSLVIMGASRSRRKEITLELLNLLKLLTGRSLD